MPFQLAAQALINLLLLLFTGIIRQAKRFLRGDDRSLRNAIMSDRIIITLEIKYHFDAKSQPVYNEILQGTCSFRKNDFIRVSGLM